MSQEERTAPTPSRSELIGGTVHRLHRKPETAGEHGLPKAAVPEILLTPAGVEGDFNRYRHESKHDDPDMAVLLMPLETLEELRREGWPMAPGDVGENITTSGIAYAEFRPGRSFAVGEAELTVSKPCTPCENLYLLPYVGPSKGPALLKTILGRRGWFARVDRPGRVRVGDRIRPLRG